MRPGLRIASRYQDRLPRSGETACPKAWRRWCPIDAGAQLLIFPSSSFGRSPVADCRWRAASPRRGKGRRCRRHDDRRGEWSVLLLLGGLFTEGRCDWSWSLRSGRVGDSVGGSLARDGAVAESWFPGKRLAVLSVLLPEARGRLAIWTWSTDRGLGRGRWIARFSPFWRPFHQGRVFHMRTVRFLSSFTVSLLFTSAFPIVGRSGRCGASASDVCRGAAVGADRRTVGSANADVGSEKPSKKF